MPSSPCPSAIALHHQLAVFREKKVDCHVFYLVFGESVLNDGVCIVLFDAFAHMVRAGGHEGNGNVFLELLLEFVVKFAGSYLLGFAAGMLSAWFSSIPI